VWWLLVLVLIVVVIGIVAVVMERRRSTVGPDAREDRIKNPRRGPVMAGYVPLNRSSTVRRRRKLLKWCGRTRLRGLMGDRVPCCLKGPPHQLRTTPSSQDRESWAVRPIEL